MSINNDKMGAEKGYDLSKMGTTEKGFYDLGRMFDNETSTTRLVASLLGIIIPMFSFITLAVARKHVEALMATLTVIATGFFYGILLIAGKGQDFFAFVTVMLFFVVLGFWLLGIIYFASIVLPDIYKKQQKELNEKRAFDKKEMLRVKMEANNNDGSLSSENTGLKENDEKASVTHE